MPLDTNPINSSFQRIVGPQSQTGYANGATGISPFGTPEEQRKNIYDALSAKALAQRDVQEMLDPRFKALRLGQEFEYDQMKKQLTSSGYDPMQPNKPLSAQTYLEQINKQSIPMTLDEMQKQNNMQGYDYSNYLRGKL